MFNLCMCGAAAGYPHDPNCPYPLFSGTRDQYLDWQTAYRENCDYAAGAARSDAADRAYAEVLARHGYDVGQLPDQPPLNDGRLAAACQEARAAAQQILDEPVEKYQ
ncbi:MAG: hypothetical protein KKA73_18400 [Chloroflexi bacterium]|nr:hypothetical protein [Chloroflexota bacterium]